ncbi:class I SAM-dependent methyltransferase [Eubacteriaceae bacterium ES3]|nr:class I SAM-dependent methyltransferase [Eubacteriaceae bacterium ES3]
MVNNSLRITDLVWRFLEPVICTGDKVLDATAGNGNDTLGLARAVGETGKVFAFDIQKSAIDKTQLLLEQNELRHRVRLIQAEHSNFDKYLEDDGVNSIKAVTINLGYLPGGTQEVVTKTETTMVLLNKCLCFLEAGGLMTVCLYPGHPEGQKETATVLDWARNLEKPFVSHHFQTLNRNHPPTLLIVQKMGVI